MSFEVSQLAAGYLSVGARPTIHSDFGREHRGTDASDAPAEFDTLLASWPGATAPVSKLRPPPPAAPRRRSECSNTSTTEFPDNVVEDECGVFVMEPALESDDEDGGLGAFMMAPTVESDDDFDRPVEFDLVELDDAKKESKQSSEPFNDDGGSPPMGMSPVLASALQMVGKHTSTGDRLPFRQSSE
eukprot:TRINITY_DN1559_c0_g2_i6.p1 TRINITY_DN1559_c0_g2~~TRINITY_DN1559_c0_g2_i6.p1  ORF type:complete len:187 (-),score=36.97 TRINITY_DN1559_c0_g2_i6:433-993(-)